MLGSQTAPQIKRGNEVWKSWFPKRGEVYLINLGEDGLGSEQRGLRPAVIVSNNRGNQYGTVIQVAPITSQKKTYLPVHVELTTRDGMKSDSIICIEQTKCISKERAFINGRLTKLAELNINKINEIDVAIKIQFGL